VAAGPERPARADRDHQIARQPGRAAQRAARRRVRCRVGEQAEDHQFLSPGSRAMEPRPLPPAADARHTAISERTPACRPHRYPSLPFTGLRRLAALLFGHAAPDPVHLLCPQRERQAFGPDRAACADCFRLRHLLQGLTSGGDWEEQIGIGVPAGRKRPPAPIGNQRRSRPASAPANRRALIHLLAPSALPKLTAPARMHRRPPCHGQSLLITTRSPSLKPSRPNRTSPAAWWHHCRACRRGSPP
jgi:hypothetical protein